MYLITRADWDGLVCAVLLTSVESLSGIEFAHPRDMQDGKVDVKDDAIIANLPFHPRCALWFDHHQSEEEMAAALGAQQAYQGKFAVAPSAARLVYDYFNSPALKQFDALVEATDRYDSAQLTMDDVLNPQGYIQLAYTIDPRTTVTDVKWQDFFFHMLGLLKEYPPEKIREDEMVKRVLEKIRSDDDAFELALRKYSRVEGHLVVTDFRGVKELPTGNRFLVHALYPETNVAARIFDAKGGRVTLSLGHSIFKRDCQTNVGRLLGEYGGGGHKGAGTVQFFPGDADAKIKEVLETVKKNG